MGLGSVSPSSSKQPSEVEQKPKPEAVRDAREAQKKQDNAPPEEAEAPKKRDDAEGRRTLEVA